VTSDEPNLIQEALQHASIDITHFLHSDESETESAVDMNAGMCSQSVSDGAAGDTLGNEEQSGGSVSHLWTSVKESDRLEI
jgi:hypothetical protein